MNIEAIVAMLALGVTIASNLVWAINQHTNNEKKKYAAERDFQSLQQGQQQIGQDIRNCFQDTENHLTLIERDIQEIKIIFTKKI